MDKIMARPHPPVGWLCTENLVFIQIDLRQEFQTTNEIVENSIFSYNTRWAAGTGYTTTRDLLNYQY